MTRAVLPLLAFVLAATAHAGGHFDVDDAGTLDPGRCQYELWAGRFGAAEATDYHVGPACRVGPVELGLNIDRYSALDAHGYVVGPQLKWTYFGNATDVPLEAAISAGLSYDVTHGGHTGGQLVFPVSWRALESLSLHANLGADWDTVNGKRTGRGGVQAEWALNGKASLIFERFRAFDIWTSRVGLRYSVTPMLSVDLSGSRSGTNKVWGYVIGVNQEFRGL